jgi:hypothetical protein
VPDDALRRALRTHAISIDQIVARFLDDLETVVTRAQSVLQNKLLTLLKFDEKHAILRTPKNQRILRRLPVLWQTALDDSGLASVIQRYLDAFPSQIPAFIDILHAMNSLANTPYPIPTFNQSDYAYFNSLRLSAGADLSALVENAAAGVLTRTAYSLGALRYTDLVSHIQRSTDASVGRAENIADTGISMFFASVAATGYEKIQADSETALTYKYFGPDDRLTREFCESLLQKNRSYTRSQIDSMTNSQIPNVFVSRGGFRCRHIWALVN